MEQKLVVHSTDGTIYKGVTHDFDAEREVFHFLPAEGGGVPLKLKVADMKALFWVRDYIGNRKFVARRQFENGESAQKAIVTFNDGEEIWGTLDEGVGTDIGFFLTPSDRADNNVRIFVVRSALKDVRMM